jgi:hypothetical protein
VVTLTCPAGAALDDEAGAAATRRADAGPVETVPVETVPVDTVPVDAVTPP